MKKLNDKDLKKVDGGSCIITVRGQTFRNAGPSQHLIYDEMFSRRQRNEETPNELYTKSWW